MTITKLEKLIIDLAAQSVRQIRDFSGRALSEQDVCDANTSFFEGSALVQLALIADNGMSQEAQTRLNEIEKDMASAMADLRKEQSTYSPTLRQMGGQTHQ